MNARLGGRQQLIALIAISVVLFAVLSILAPATYPTLRNLTSMGFQMSGLGILALAIGLTFLIGGLDLSVVAVSNMAAITAAVTMTRFEPALGTGGAVVLGVVAALAVGAVAGLINGTLVSRLRVHPIVITLGTLTLFTGIATGLTGGSTVFGIRALSLVGRGTVLGIPIPLLVFIGLAVGLSVLTTRTRWGFRAYALGASEEVSRFGRISVERIQVTTYFISGMLAATAGLLSFARTDAANVSFGSSQLILAILIAVLAGITPYGGRGRILLVVLAVAAMQQLSTGINLALGQWSGAVFAAEFAYGVLLIAVLGWGERSSGGSGSGRLASWLKRDGAANVAAVQGGEGPGEPAAGSSTTGPGAPAPVDGDRTDVATRTRSSTRSNEPSDKERP
jgi:simple sugar transport system permease protein